METAGFKVRHHVDGQPVVGQVVAIHPGACIVDIVMPSKDGLRTILEWVTKYERPKIIAVSSRQDYLDLALRVWTDATLIKTISPEALMTTLQTLEVLQ